MPTDDDFKQVVLNSDVENACSPPVNPEEDFQGIRINVPTQVQIDPAEPAQDGSFVALPVCGFYQLDLGMLITNSTIWIHAKNMETQEVFSGLVFENDPGIEEPDDEPPLEPHEVAGQSISAYFNPNLPKYVAIPAEAAKYQVMVQIGEVRSNIVEVQVIGPPIPELE
ncbi:MAG: hypothetical protein O3A63_12960 [Proteobacteria bacterium]|nr:hypothetical protein [Pseudomonadota bacterium]